MKRTFVLALAAVCMTSLVHASVIPQQENKDATRIGRKIRQLDLLNQILPVLMTREQLRKLLPIIEEIRQKQQDIEKRELEVMKGVEADVDKAVAGGLEKGKVPPEELFGKLQKITEAFTITRQIHSGQSVAKILEFMKKELNEGQRKAAANALDPRIFDPKVDVATMSDDEKLKYWIRAVILDYEAYDLLVKLAK